jgi:hypothetical protein
MEVMPGLKLLKHHLEQDVAHGVFSPTQKCVLAYGQLYVGIKRPSGFRLGRQKQCFVNAAEAIFNADSEPSTKLSYVEGYAAVPGMPPFHHAWIALDDQYAIELTVRNDPLEMTFFAISFSSSEVIKLLTKSETYGLLGYLNFSAVSDLVQQRKLGAGRRK